MVWQFYAPLENIAPFEKLKLIRWFSNNLQNELRRVSRELENRDDKIASLTRELVELRIEAHTPDVEERGTNFDLVGNSIFYPDN